MKLFVKILIITSVFFNSCKSGNNIKNPNLQTTGPKSGSLILVGGHLQSPEIYDKFRILAGGGEKPIVIVVTAAGDELFQDSSYIQSVISRFKNNGFQSIKILHTRSKDIANTEEFYKPISETNALWFTGGRQWRLMDAYAGTKTYDEFIKLLDRGGVIGGSSAGATIQGSYLARGDTKTNLKMMGDHEEGFSFIKNIAVDQHLLAMNRQFDIFDILDNKPGLLGIGLDENTAIVVHRNEFEVIGEHYVAVYDGTFFSEIRDKEDWNKIRYEQTPLPKGSRKFYLLKKGQKYDMLNRKVIPN